MMGHNTFPIVDVPADRLQPLIEPNMDWTTKDGISNTSDRYLELCKEVERLIRSDAHTLINGRADATARLIVSHLAHKHNIGPIARVPLSFEDFQLIRNSLAEAEGALRVTTKAAGKRVNQSGAEVVLASINRASALLHSRAFPEEQQ